MVGDVIALRSGPFEVVLAPAVGGSIARFEHDGRPILRGAADGESDVLKMGCFPLVPYCNRIRGGRFDFRGREIVIAPNMGGDPSPLHGQGWLARWTIEWATQDEGILSFDHEAGEWPWSYESRQHFRLDGRGLGIALSCRNLSEGPMPCGLGLHPYFPCGGETALDTHVEDVWTVDEDVLPVERQPATGRFALAQRKICGQDLDNGFSRWSGSAEISEPGAPAVRISSPNAGYFQVYSPAAGGLFVAEPVTHANAALNEPEERWASLGLRILQPGETATLDARIEVSQAG